jgi:hypothetical protein
MTEWNRNGRKEMRKGLKERSYQKSKEKYMNKDRNR